MAVTKIAAVLLVVGLVVGVVAGYGVGFITTRPQISQLQSNLSETQSALSKSRSEVDSLGGQLTETKNKLTATEAELTKAQTTITELKEDISVVTAKLDAINATMPKLEKDLKLLEALSKPFPTSYTDQLSWFQNVRSVATEVDARLPPLIDKAIADYKTYVEWVTKQPTNVYTVEWVDWAIQYFKLEQIYLKDSSEFSNLLYAIIIADINNALKAIK